MAGRPAGAREIAWLFFGLSGRVSRLAYVLAGLLMVTIQGFLIYRVALAPEESAELGFWALAFFAVGVAAVWSSFALSVKRLHDFDKPGILAILLFIPAVSLVAFVVLCFYPGTIGPNSYGEHTNAPS